MSTLGTVSRGALAVRERCLECRGHLLAKSSHGIPLTLKGLRRELAALCLHCKVERKVQAAAFLDRRDIDLALDHHLAQLEETASSV